MGMQSPSCRKIAQQTPQKRQMTLAEFLGSPQKKPPSHLDRLASSAIQYELEEAKGSKPLS